MTQTVNLPVDVRGGAENCGGAVGGRRVSHGVARADQGEGRLLHRGVTRAGSDGRLYRAAAAVTPLRQTHLQHASMGMKRDDAMCNYPLNRLSCYILR